MSVSNPKNKYVAYLPVLSQMSNCQGLGRKNKHEILKTNRTVGSLIEILWFEEAYHGPQSTGICVKKKEMCKKKTPQECRTWRG